MFLWNTENYYGTQMYSIPYLDYVELMVFQIKQLCNMFEGYDEEGDLDADDVDAGDVDAVDVDTGDVDVGDGEQTQY